MSLSQIQVQNCIYWLVTTLCSSNVQVCSLVVVLIDRREKIAFDTEICGLPANYFDDNRKYERMGQEEMSNEKRLSLSKAEIQRTS